MDAEKMAALLEDVRTANAKARLRRSELSECQERAREAAEKSLAADKALGDYLTALVGDRSYVG